jgi:uncharacterized membrane protein
LRAGAISILAGSIPARLELRPPGHSDIRIRVSAAVLSVMRCRAFAKVILILEDIPLIQMLRQLRRSAQRNIIAGIITIGPLFVTCLVFSFVLGNLVKAGLPVVRLLDHMAPGGWGAWTGQPWLQSVLAVLLTLLVLYVVGLVTSLVVGRQMFRLFETALERLPFVAKIYSSVRQLLDSMMAKTETTQRVVLINFPVSGQKSVGFLTRTLIDSSTGQELAAVLLPNAINPTSAFLQLLPLEEVTETDLTMEQAMSMLLTGGAVSPESIRFSPIRETEPR